MQKIYTYYEQNSQYGKRAETDALIRDPYAQNSFDGVCDRNARFVEKNSLLDAEYWTLFVKQFTSNVDDHDLGWRGEFFGKMMRGASFTYMYTKNEELYAILEKTAVEMLKVQDEFGRFSTYSKSCEFHEWDLWCRKYVMLGFLHFHEICKNEQLKKDIIAALEKHLDYIASVIGDDQYIKIHCTSMFWESINSASILEPTVRMYNITKKPLYLKFIKHILSELSNCTANIITLALEDKIAPYQYPTTKAYEMMSCFEGVIEYYRVTGEEKWPTAARNFVNRVWETDISIIGCAGCLHELFNHTSATQTDTSYTGIMQETCVTVTWMKLLSQLLWLTGESRYADMIELSAYNSLYGAVNHELTDKNGGNIFDSYSPLTRGTRGRSIAGYKDIAEGKHYGCCAAIGTAGTALIPLNAVLTSKKGIAVNFFEKGSIKVSGFELNIDTDYPVGHSVKLTVVSAPEGESEIKIRIPAYSLRTVASFNNTEVKATAGEYLGIVNTFKKGDVIHIALDMNLRLVYPEGMAEKPETKNFLAVMYGPLVLARDARIGGVGEVISPSEDIKMELLDSVYSSILHANVTIGDKTIEMIDYASAGKTWDEESECEAWMPTK